MKRILRSFLTLLMLVVWASGFAQDTETIDFSSLGFSNAQRISKVQGENVTLTFTANGGTAPAYYNSGTAIRMYDNNILNISSKKTIAGIDFELSQGNLNKSCFNSGTYNGTTNKWSGEATNIKITNKTSAQVRLKKLIITYKATSSNPTLTFSETEKTVYKGAESEFTMPTLVLKDKEGKEVTSGVEYLYEVTDANPEGCLDVDMTTGKVNFKKLGTANIKVTTSTANTGSELNNLTASFKLTYMKDPAAKDKLFFAEAEKTVYVGKTDGFDGLSATQYDVKGAEVTPDVITYEATPTGVVDIDGTTGKIKNWLKTGTVTIKATSMYSDEIYEASYVLNYKKIATTLTLSKTSVTVNLGEAPELPTCTLKAGDEVLTKPLSYIISPDEIANIDSSTGELTLISVGKATVGVSFDGDETYESSNVATYDLTVIDPNADEVTFDFSQPADYGDYEAPAKNGNATNLEEGNTLTSGVVTITNVQNGWKINNKGVKSTNKSRFHMYQGTIQFRTYENAVLTLSVADGYVITGFVYNSAKGENLTVSTGSYDKNNKKWTGSAKSIELAINDAFQFENMTVAYSKLSSIGLDESKDNAETISGNADKTVNVKLTRTLKADVWNTFCVPFDVTVAGSPLEGATIKQIASVEEKTDGAVINFEDAPANLEAGKAYLVRTATAIVNPTFNGVTVKNVDPTNCSRNENYQLIGIYSPKNIDASLYGKVFGINNQDKLAKVMKDTSINGMRAYFLLANSATAAKLNFGGELTGIDAVDNGEAVMTGKVYNLNGQYVGNSLEGLKKGVYVVNGKKVLK